MTEPVQDIDYDGTEYWWRGKELHRDDGPAVISANGTRHWIRDDRHHREDGPAIIHLDGRCSWWLNGHCFTFWEWLERLDADPNTKIILALKWGDQ